MAPRSASRPPFAPYAFPLRGSAPIHALTKRGVAVQELLVEVDPRGRSRAREELEFTVWGFRVSSGPSAVRDRELYAKLLGIEAPWFVENVDAHLDDGKVEVHIGFDRETRMECPECGEACSRYDSRKRSWRHLDTMQFRTVLTADVPRIECVKHGVKQVRVPWAEPGSRFTALFECLVIDWLTEASISAVAKMLRVTWDEVDGVMSRVVARGLARREPQPLRHIGVDVTSFQKRHEYVTVVYDTERSRVVEVLNGRNQEDLENFCWDTPLEHVLSIESVSMDMWPAYIGAVQNHVDEPEKKICFDRFHGAKHLGDAVNNVRTEETAELRALGDRTLVGTRFLWRQNPKNMKRTSRVRFSALRNSTFRVARAWAMKEVARGLWNYRVRGWAKRGWTKLINWMSRSRLKPMVAKARMLRVHLWGIINAIVLRATYAHLESTNAKIQALKKRACGYRNRDRFRHAILFHCGRLDLHPQLATHTVS